MLWVRPGAHRGLCLLGGQVADSGAQVGIGSTQHSGLLRGGLDLPPLAVVGRAQRRSMCLRSTTCTSQAGLCSNVGLF